MTAAPEVDQGADRLPAALLILTAVTGLVDAVSVLGFGVFTANMTGNVVFLGFAAAGARGFSIARSLTSLVAFLAGAVIGGGVSVAIDATRRRWLLTVAVCEATLLFVAALASIGLEIGAAYACWRSHSFMQRCRLLQNRSSRKRF